MKDSSVITLQQLNGLPFRFLTVGLWMKNGIDLDDWSEHKDGLHIRQLPPHPSLLALR